MAIRLPGKRSILANKPLLVTSNTVIGRNRTIFFSLNQEWCKQRTNKWCQILWLAKETTWCSIMLKPTRLRASASDLIHQATTARKGSKNRLGTCTIRDTVWWDPTFLSSNLECHPRWCKALGLGQSCPLISSPLVRQCHQWPVKKWWRNHSQDSLPLVSLVWQQPLAKPQFNTKRLSERTRPKSSFSRKKSEPRINFSMTPWRVLSLVPVDAVLVTLKRIKAWQQN